MNRKNVFDLSWNCMARFTESRNCNADSCTILPAMVFRQNLWQFSGIETQNVQNKIYALHG